MSDKPLIQRLVIKPGYRIIIMGAPAGYAESLGPLPDGARIAAAPAADADVVQVFARTRIEMESALALGKPMLRPGGLLWATYPKAGQLGTDLKRDVVWGCAAAVGLQPVAQIAIDEVWSALRLKAEGS